MALWALVNSASAALLLGEDFDYADGPLTNVAAGLWAWHSGNGGALTLNCISSCAFIDQNDSSTGCYDYNRALSSSFDVLADNTSKIYVSLTVNFSALPNAAVTNLSGSYFAHLKSSAVNEFYGRLGANLVGAAPGKFRMAVTSEAWPTTGTIQFPQDLDLNRDYRVVMKYDLATDRLRYGLTRLMKRALAWLRLTHPATSRVQLLRLRCGKERLGWCAWRCFCGYGAGSDNLLRSSAPCWADHHSTAKSRRLFRPKRHLSIRPESVRQLPVVLRKRIHF